MFTEQKQCNDRLLYFAATVIINILIYQSGFLLNINVEECKSLE